MPKFQREHSHPRYKNGQYVNEWGYVRVSVGRTHSKYEHRLVIENLMLEQAIVRILGSVRAPKKQAMEIMSAVLHPPEIPAGVTIHHIDSNRQHNCPENLMLLDDVIHRAITADRRRWLKRREQEAIMQTLRDIAC